MIIGSWFNTINVFICDHMDTLTWKQSGRNPMSFVIIETDCTSLLSNVKIFIASVVYYGGSRMPPLEIGDFIVGHNIIVFAWHSIIEIYFILCIGEIVCNLLDF